METPILILLLSVSVAVDAALEAVSDAAADDVADDAADEAADVALDAVDELPQPARSPPAIATESPAPSSLLPNSFIFHSSCLFLHITVIVDGTVLYMLNKKVDRIFVHVFHTYAILYIYILSFIHRRFC